MFDHLLARPADHRIAADIATAAGELLVQTRDRLIAEGVEGRALKDAGDEAAHLFIVEQLANAAPGDAVLSEEGKDDLARLDADRVWIVDPLDGTREYSESRSDWAVHVALTMGGVPVAGAVAQPGLGRTFATDPVEPMPAAADRPPIMVVSRTRPPAAALAVAEALGGTLLEMGSAGAKAMSVLLGDSDVYVHAGGQYEWDSCAPVAVAAAAGLHTSRVDGSPLVYNCEDVYLPDLVVCRPELADKVLEVLAARDVA